MIVLIIPSGKDDPLVDKTLGYSKSIKNSVFYCTDAIESRVLSCKAPIVCINDSVYNTKETHEHNKKFFETKFPNKSEFEK